MDLIFRCHLTSTLNARIILEFCSITSLIDYRLNPAVTNWDADLESVAGSPEYYLFKYDLTDKINYRMCCHLNENTILENLKKLGKVIETLPIYNERSKYVVVHLKFVKREFFQAMKIANKNFSMNFLEHMKSKFKLDGRLDDLSFDLNF